MAQSAEHILGKDEVPGSNPGISSRNNTQIRTLLLRCPYLCIIITLQSSRNYSAVLITFSTAFSYYWHGRI